MEWVIWSRNPVQLTVEENVTVLETLPISKKERKERLESLLEELKTVSRKTKSVYSGGERRHLETPVRLSQTPRDFADEPFADDPLAVHDVQQIVVFKNKGLGVLITDHNVRETSGY